MARRCAVVLVVGAMVMGGCSTSWPDPVGGSPTSSWTQAARPFIRKGPGQRTEAATFAREVRRVTDGLRTFELDFAMLEAQGKTKQLVQKVDLRTPGIVRVDKHSAETPDLSIIVPGDGYVYMELAEQDFMRRRVKELDAETRESYETVADPLFPCVFLTEGMPGEVVYQGPAEETGKHRFTYDVSAYHPDRGTEIVLDLVVDDNLRVHKSVLSRDGSRRIWAEWSRWGEDMSIAVPKGARITDM